VSSVWELIAENRIAEAIERGEFENLPGKGKALDLTAYFDTPVEDRMAFSILKNAGVVPAEVELMNEVERLRAQRERCASAKEELELTQQLQAATAKLAFRMEQRITVVGRRGIRTSSVVY